MPTDFSGKNIVHIVRQYAPNIGGLEDVVRNLVAQQKDQFASVKVVTLDRLFSAPDEVLPAADVIDGVTVERIPFFGSHRYPIAPSVFGCIKDADLVHVHAIDFFFDAFALARVLHRKPLVATTHGGFFHTQKYKALKSVWFQTLTRISAAQYRGLACCSQSDLDQFARIAPKKAMLIENGVNLEKFGNAASHTAKKRLITIGRFSNNKRLDRVLDVLSCLERDTGSWSLDIVGSASDLDQADLSEMIAERQLDAHVRVLTGLSDGEVRKAIEEASFFVSASEYEGFGLALIEAMSAGLVPVVHPNEAFRGLSNKNPQIELADFSNPQNVATAISKRWSDLQDQPQLRQNMMEAANQYSWPATADRYQKFYAQVLNL